MLGDTKDHVLRGEVRDPAGKGSPAATDPHADGWELRAVNLLAQLSNAESPFMLLSKS